MKFDDLIGAIDSLDAAQADEIIDWQLTESPAAKIEHGPSYFSCVSEPVPPSAPGGRTVTVTIGYLDEEGSR